MTITFSSPPLKTPIEDQGKTGVFSHPWMAWLSDVGKFIKSLINVKAPLVLTTTQGNQNLSLSYDNITLVVNAAGQLQVSSSYQTSGIISGSGKNGLPYLRLGVSNSDNIVKIQTSQDGKIWIDTDSVIYMP